MHPTPSHFNQSGANRQHKTSQTAHIHPPKSIALKNRVPIFDGPGTRTRVCRMLAPDVRSKDNRKRRESRKSNTRAAVNLSLVQIVAVVANHIHVRPMKTKYRAENGSMLTARSQQPQLCCKLTFEVQAFDPSAHHPPEIPRSPTVVANVPPRRGRNSAI